mmetsp:Transcript_42824/g.140676  ORF Transcript_42824/g.140676 Transcript_42824/m.140676 type:complete len:84 (+) Transcript_42824:42-293(+)
MMSQCALGTDIHLESVRAADRDYDQIFERIHGAAAPTRALLQKMREDARADLAARLQALQRRCSRRPDRRLQGVAGTRGRGRW